MPKLATLSAYPLRPFVSSARGLHDPDSEKTYFFDHFDTRMISIGRGTRCDVRLTERRVSHAHARVKLRRDGRAMLRDLSRNGTYIDGRKLDGEVELTPGMQIHLGSVAMLVVTNASGAFPLLVHSIAELCYYAVELYGNPTAASRVIGRSREFVEAEANKYRDGRRSWWRRISKLRRRSNRIVLLTGKTEPS